MPKTAVIINQAAGSAKDDGLIGQIHQLFLAHGAQVDVLSTKNLIETTQQLLDDGYLTIVAAGGDGTISAVAGIVAKSGKAKLGVLPLGTLNHFAKDLNIPQEISQAVETIVSGQTVKVDIAQVNHQSFINNSSIGLYPEVVCHREAREQKLGKWLALAVALAKTLRTYRLHNVTLETDDRQIVRQTPLVFIGNNNYRVEAFGLTNRQSLNQGLLYVYVVRRANRLSLLGLTLRLLLGRIQWDRHFESYPVKTLTIKGGQKSLAVAIDGEAILLELPLCYEIKPLALTVIVPLAGKTSDN